MPSFNVGAKGEGGVGGLFDLVLERKKEFKDRETEVRKNRQRLVELGFKDALDDNTIIPEFDSAGAFTNRWVKAPKAASLTPADLLGAGGGSQYGPPKVSFDMATGKSTASFDPLSPTESGKQEELNLTRQSTPMPTDRGQGVTNLQTGAISDFNPDEEAMGVGDWFRGRRLSALQAPEEAKQRKQNFAESTKLRQEFINRAEVKNWIEVETQLRLMDSTYNRWRSGDIKSANAVDQAIVNTIGRMLDPGATVREAEYQRTPQNMALINSADAWMKRISKGGVLNDNEREGLLQVARILADARGETFNQTLQSYDDLAQKFQLDSDVITRGMKPHQPYNFGPPTNSGSASERSFNTEAEALRAKLPIGTIVTINGRRARID